MNLSFFIAQRVNKHKKNIQSTTITNVSVVSIAISTIIMLLSIAIINGFRDEIKTKTFNFGSHITIGNYDNNNSFEPTPINKDAKLISDIKKNSAIKSVFPFITKAGIIKTPQNIQGIILKGVDYDFDWSNFKKNIIKGNIFKISKKEKSNNIIISQNIANKLKLKIGDKVKVFFAPRKNQIELKARQFKISAIYKTDIEEIDKIFAIVDIKHLQKINNWTQNQITGLEIIVKNTDNLEKISSEIYELCGNMILNDGSKLNVQNLKEKYAAIFDWLDIINFNTLIILTIMLVVAIINVVIQLFTLIFEQKQIIIMLKCMGMSISRIRKIFIYQTIFVFSKGLLIGNIIGLIICFVQWKFQLIPLDTESYYISNVPIKIDILQILLLNILFISIIAIMLIIPSFWIKKVKTDKISDEIY